MGIVLLDDCNFHESVRLDDFDSERALTLVSIYALHIDIWRSSNIALISSNSD